MDPARLTGNPIFSQLEPAELSRLAAFATEESFAVGKEIVREDDYSTEVYVIEEGTADIIKQGTVIGSVGPGDVVGEIGVLAKSKRTAAVVVTAPMLAIKITHWEIRRLSSDTRAKLEAIAARRRGSDPDTPAPVLD